LIVHIVHFQENNQPVEIGKGKIMYKASSMIFEIRFWRGEGRGWSAEKATVPKLCPSRLNISKWFQMKPKVS
jgi:hypothetical protein